MNSIFETINIPATLRSIAQQVSAGERISATQALTLYTEAPLFLLSELALSAKRKKSGESVFYNKNFHIEPTNICLFNCKFCSYRRAVDTPDAWNMSLEQIEEHVARFDGIPVTEVHIVGGVHPQHTIHYYAEMVRRVKALVPQATIKAFSAIELIYMIEKAGLTYHQGLTLLWEAGMETLPGGGAEIFDPEIRTQICPDKPDAEKWLALHSAAHQVGITTNATMLYGHIEHPEHRISHMERLRHLQDQTGGFNAFIPLKYRSMHNSLSEIGETSVVDDLRTLALARIFLDNFAHIKAYWPMYGKQTTQTALLFGADDVDGTIGDTTKIYSMAGAEDRSPQMTEEQLRAIITEAGFTPVERDSFYRAVTQK